MHFGGGKPPAALCHIDARSARLYSGIRAYPQCGAGCPATPRLSRLRASVHKIKQSERRNGDIVTHKFKVFLMITEICAIFFNTGHLTLGITVSIGLT